VQRRRALDELACARMIGLQFQSAANLFRFHAARLALMERHGLKPPCDLPRTNELAGIMRDEIANARAAIPLVESDPRLGYHLEAHAYMYTPALIRAKIARMEEELVGQGNRG
jgi:hypothetical protein